MFYKILQLKTLKSLKIWGNPHQKKPMYIWLERVHQEIKINMKLHSTDPMTWCISLIGQTVFWRIKKKLAFCCYWHILWVVPINQLIITLTQTRLPVNLILPIWSVILVQLYSDQIFLLRHTILSADFCAG